MTDIIIEWLSATSLVVDDSLLFVAVVAVSCMFLNFLFDIFRFVAYYIANRKD